MKLAVLGAGRWGRNFIRTIPEIPGAELSCVFSRNPETRSLVKCPVVSDWAEAFAVCDAVVVATPSSTHAQIALAALAAKKPVLLEKPVALTAADARRILEEARLGAGYVLVDHILLFNPAYELLKKRAKRVERIEAVGGNAGPFREDASPLWDYGPHDVAVALDLFGEDPASVSAARDGENFRLTLEFTGGRRADIRLGNKFPSKLRVLKAMAGKHAFVFDDLAPHKLVEDGHPVAVPAELPLTRALAAFVAAASAGSRDLSSLELGVRVVEVLARAEAALK